MPRITLEQTDWYGNFGSDGHMVEMRLWVGKDQNGNPVSAWMPEWIPAELYDAGVSQFESHRPVQARRASSPVRKQRVLRANKVRGAN